MQTFFPYPDPHASARVLDNARLGKQRVECVQILNSLLMPVSSKAWRNHPAVKMWRGYEAYLLAEYMGAMLIEWSNRGYKGDLCIAHFRRLADLVPNTIRHPHWLGDLAFHESHQSNLIRKKPSHYGPIWPDVPDNLEYVWPNPLGEGD